MKVRPLWLWVLALAVGCGGSSHPKTDAGSERSDAGDAAVEAAAPDAPSADGPGDGGAPESSSSDGGSDAGADGNDDARDAGPTSDASDGGAEVAPPFVSGSPLRALAVSTGLLDTCALLDNHRIKCWGYDAYGSLGRGGTPPVEAAAQRGNAIPFVDLGTGRTATAIASGRYHACAILDDGNVKCWGLREMTGQNTIVGQTGVGDEAGEMGDALPTLDLGGHKATKIACGYSRSCALLDDGSLRCWGSSAAERLPTPAPLGSTSKVRQLAAASGVFALFEDGTTSLPTLGLASGDRAAYLAGSQSSLCAVLEDGRLMCAAPRPAPATPPDLTAVGVGLSSFLCGLSRSGDVRCWNSQCNSYPPGTIYWCPSAARADQSYAVGLGQKAVAITTGALDHACALLADGSIKCWTNYDQCPNAAGGAEACPVPPTVSENLAGSLDIVGTGASRKYGAWRSIDLGTHP